MGVEAGRSQAELWRALGLPEDVEGASRGVPSLLGRMPRIDVEGLEEAAARTRPLPSAFSDSPGLLAGAVVRLLDLTSLAATDTPRSAHQLCERALSPDPEDTSCPLPSAVCVYPDLLPVVAQALKGSPVAACSVAGGFPSGRTTMPVRLLELSELVAAGVGEVDVVLDRAAWLSGDVSGAFEQLATFRAVLPEAVVLKVILETSELSSYANISSAAMMSLVAGADMVKSSTGKSSPQVSLPQVLLMLHAVRMFEDMSGARAGVKISGGVSSPEAAFALVSAAEEVLGPEAFDPSRFRLGASKLLDALTGMRRDFLG